MDKIKISELEIYGHHGVMKEENVLGQKFLVSAELYTDIRKAGKSDDISDSINYAEVSHFIKEFMQKHTFQLIEAVAENLSQEILLKFSQVQKICLTVKKPWAPILLPLDTVSVEVKRGWKRVYLSIGSNMGDKQAHLKRAVHALKSDQRIKVKAVSEFLITKPYGNLEQEDFLNGAVSIDTLYTPYELLDRIHEIEKEDGRERKVHWGPRTIDLDILLYENNIMEEDELTIPHPEMHMRQFVLEPLKQIAPWAKHPVFGMTVEALNRQLNNS